MTTSESRYEYVARWRMKNGATRSSDAVKNPARSLWEAKYAAREAQRKGYEPRIERRVVTTTRGEWEPVDLQAALGLPSPDHRTPAPDHHLSPEASDVDA